MAQPTAAVVGGGVSGSVAAVALRSAGFRVKLFDQGRRGPGGRASSRSIAAGGLSSPLVVDHGAQFFRATNPSFQALLHAPLCKGLFARWEGRFGVLGAHGGLLPTAVIRSGLGGELAPADADSAAKGSMGDIGPPCTPAACGRQAADLMVRLCVQPQTSVTSSRRERGRATVCTWACLTHNPCGMGCARAPASSWNRV